MNSDVTSTERSKGHFLKNQNKMPGRAIITRETMVRINWPRKARSLFSGVSGDGGMPQSESFGSCSLSSFSMNELYLTTVFNEIKIKSTNNDIHVSF